MATIHLISAYEINEYKVTYKTSDGDQEGTTFGPSELTNVTAGSIITIYCPVDTKIGSFPAVNEMRIIIARNQVFPITTPITTGSTSITVNWSYSPELSIYIDTPDFNNNIQTFPAESPSKDYTIAGNQAIYFFYPVTDAMKNGALKDFRVPGSSSITPYAGLSKTSPITVVPLILYLLPPAAGNPVNLPSTVTIVNASNHDIVISGYALSANTYITYTAVISANILSPASITNSFIGYGTEFLIKSSSSLRVNINRRVGTLTITDIDGTDNIRATYN